MVLRYRMYFTDASCCIVLEYAVVNNDYIRMGKKMVTCIEIMDIRASMLLFLVVSV